MFPSTRSIRHLQRYSEIVAIFARHGFGFLFYRPEPKRPALFRIPWRSSQKSTQPQVDNLAVHFREALEELGPTFIKFGQILSTRPDILPLSFITELSKLVDSVSPEPWEKMRALLAHELGREPETLFASIDPQPQIQDYIEKFREEFKKMPAEDISFPRSINGLKEYGDSKMIYKKGTPIHVRGALIHNHNIDQLKIGKTVQKIQEGEKIKFIYLKEPNPLQTDVISFLNRIPKEFDIDKYIDYNLQFEKSFVDPLRIILDCIDWKPEKVNSLESFFG